MMDPAFVQRRPRSTAEQLDGCSLFDAVPDAPGEQLLAQLTTIARELAGKAGDAGVTIADVRSIAESRGLLTGAEKDRKLSYLGGVMKAAGLVASDRIRRSHIPRSHGNIHVLWILPPRAV